MINIVVTLIVVGVLLWLVNAYIPMDRKITSIPNVVIVIAVVLWLLSAFGVLGGLGNITVAAESKAASYESTRPFPQGDGQLRQFLYHKYAQRDPITCATGHLKNSSGRTRQRREANLFRGTSRRRISNDPHHPGRMARFTLLFAMACFDRDASQIVTKPALPSS